ncbi:MAG: hypothetical protein Q4F31_04570 [Eubacteriales bacterium]|nr:hypothetical protein [Eubacteriales bacterium]
MLSLIDLGLSAVPASAANDPVKINVLILPAFEVGTMDDDFVGEAQLYYQKYMIGADVYPITADPYGSNLYVQNGVGLYLMGQGKVSAAVNLTALLTDKRFDFSDAYFIVSGCAGSSADSSVAGDVFLVSSVVDCDLGHHADIREMSSESCTVWFPIEDYRDISCFTLNESLVEKAWKLVKDIPAETTDSARACMARNFDNAAWAVRDPKVYRGTAVAGDNYWKGIYAHNTAKQITEYYHCLDPYAVTDMEDSAAALVLHKFGMLDRLLIFRASVNMDVFLDGETPETAWNDSKLLVSADGFDGFTDIFEVAMENEFRAVGTIVDAILTGSF